jgi:nucleotide-binding universal stress UspA family protein
MRSGNVQRARRWTPIGDPVPESRPTILFCYDGSDRAKRAIKVAGLLFPGAVAKVVHVWEPVENIVARYAILAPYLGGNVAEADADVEQQSSTIAEEGAKLAQAAGFEASAYNSTLSTSVWQAIIEAAKQHDVDVIVTGTRSLHGARELLAGTLSHALLQHSTVPLLAIPTPPS